MVFAQVICSGLLVAVMGFCCGNCTLCCCNGSSKVDGDLEGNETPVKGWSGD